MTVSLGDVQNAIKKGIDSLAAVVNSASAWQDMPEPVAKRRLILNIVSMVAIQDREMNTEVSPGVWQWSLSTLYYIRVQVRTVSSYSAPKFDALQTLEVVRAGLLRPDLVWDSGVINQPDNETYIHHVSFEHQAHIESSYSFETGFRAVVDTPLSGTISSAPNMQSVEVDGTGTVPDGDHDYDFTVARP